MILLDLPTEVLQRVIEETMPEGFEDFICTCKTILHTSSIFLKRHKKLTRQYKNFKYSEGTDRSNPDNCSSSLDLIGRIASDPVIARYIVVADFKDDFYPEKGPAGDLNYNVSDFDLLTKSFEVLELLEQSPYRRDAGVDSQSILQYLSRPQAIEERDSGLAAAFLLTLLPNVTSLCLPRHWNSFHDVVKASTDGPIQSPWRMKDLLETIITGANDPHQQSASLSRLAFIPPSESWGYETCWAFSTLTPFLSLNTVRNFRAGSCMMLDAGGIDYEYTIPEHETFGAHLEVVELAGACVDAIGLRKFLSRLPRLKSLKLSYETKVRSAGYDWDATSTMVAIEECVGSTLETLSLSVLNCLGQVETENFSMKGFTKLKHVELDLELLRGIRGAWYTPDWIPPVIDILPPSVESLSLFARHSNVARHIDNDAMLACLFAGIVEEKEAKLPNLRKVVISGRYDSRREVLPSVENRASQPNRREGNTSREGGSQDVSVHTTDPQLPKWMTELKALGPSVEVQLSRRSAVYLANIFPQFMWNWFGHDGICRLRSSR